MARLPTTQSQRAIPRASRGVAQVSPSAAGAVGQAVASFGNEAFRLGDLIAEREATAIASQRDAMASDELRDLLYNPETGFMAMQGQGAVEGRDITLKRLEEIKGKALADVSGRARRKLEGAIDRRISGAMDTVERHTLQERDVWLDGAGAARIAAAQQDSLADFSVTQQSLTTIESETRAKGAREGWDDARTTLEVQAAKSGVFSSQVERIASRDPIQALAYLRQNEGQMLPQAVARLEQALQPEVRRATGRALGREAALDGVSADYLDAIRTAESGGNDLAANPRSTARGRYQFIESTWRGLMEEYPSLGLTADGRFDPEQQERAIRVFTAQNAQTLGAAGIDPTNGNLYAAHFLGAATAVKVLNANDTAPIGALVGSRVMAANPHLRGMSAGDFRAWANRKGGGDAIGYNSGSTGMETLLDIQDPLERQAALDEYSLRVGVMQSQRKAALDAAKDAAFQMIEAGGSIEDLPYTDRQALGQDNMSSLRTYEAKVRSGVPIHTDDEAYYYLRQVMAQDPQAFREINLLQYRSVLSDDDWQSMVNAQTQPAGNVTTAAASSLMTAARNQLRSVGIDTNAKPGSDDAKVIAGVQSRLTRWQDSFVQENGRAPSKTEIDERIGMEVMPIALDATMWADGGETSFAEAAIRELEPDELAGADLEIGGVSIPPEVIQEQIDVMNALGEPVTTENLLLRLGEMLRGAGQM